MPVAGFQGGQLVDGLTKDLGDAIAARLGLKVRYLPMPSKRVPLALAAGEADGLCYVLPHWIDGDFHWSRPLLPTAEVIVAQATAPALRRLPELGGKHVGTVLGYRYPALDAALQHKPMLRDDALSMAQLFVKLGLGRSPYAIVDQLSLDYHLKTDPGLKLRTELVLNRSVTQCAFSRAGKLPFEAISRAIDTLVAEGEIERMLARYR
ncbi:substrate-binding periplasmic protein [Paucibacter soli]|uniref:substrate-binding periplasmic protein n=1 Tax=Paucibacter soli TaxID=3133433 RepID=UPI0030A1615C